MPKGDPSEVLRAPELTAGARRLLETASALFYRDGLHAVGVDTIAAESGVSKRTLYDRFGTKDQLIAASLQVRHQRWWERMERRVAAHPEAPVLALCDAYREDAETVDRGCAFLNAAAELPEAHPAHRVVRAHKHAVRERLAELVELAVPGTRGPGTLAEQVFLLLEGGIAQRGVDGDDRALRSARAMTARLLEERGAAPEVPGAP